MRSSMGRRRSRRCRLKVSARLNDSRGQWSGRSLAPIGREAVRRSLRRFTTALFVLLGLWSAASSGYGTERNARGVVSDESNGVLPGVTVVATSVDGRILATTVTDEAGRYLIGPPAAGR